MKKFKHPIPKQIYDPYFLKTGGRRKAAKKNGWLEHWEEEKVFMFTWEYCSHCEKMFVRCPACGNNCCNAGFGKVKSLFEPAEIGDKKATTCPVCKLAYMYQDLAWKNNDVPAVTKKEKNKKVKENAEDKLLKKIFGE
jgi:hypothetical protein